MKTNKTMNKVVALSLGLFGLGLAQNQSVFVPDPQPAQPAAAPAQAQPAAQQPVAAPAAAQATEAAQPTQPAEAPVAAQPAPQAEVKPAEVKPAEVVAEPVVEEPVAPREKTAFDILHGSAYNRVGNEAAADNVDGLLARPDLFAGQKFFYIEPAGERGIVSLGSFFAAMDISGELGRGTIGYASNGFGASIHFGLGQFQISTDNGDSHTTEAGDDIGLTLSKVVGNFVIVYNADWNTYETETGVEPKYGNASADNFDNLSAALSISNAPSAQQNFWSAGVEFLRHENNKEVAGDLIDEGANSYIRIQPYFNYGRVALENEHARLLVGANVGVPVYLFDKYETVVGESEAVDQSLTEFGLTIAPNILGEVIVNEHLMLFGEASYQWLAFGYATGTDDAGEDYTMMQSHSNKVDASAGLRYQYANWLGCEFAFGDSFFTDTKSIFNGTGVFVSFGGFINF